MSRSTLRRIDAELEVAVGGGRMKTIYCSSGSITHTQGEAVCDTNLNCNSLTC